MKLFAVYADLELLTKPSWLDAFRAKYDKPYPYHVTLKQTCYIEEAQIVALKQRLSSFFKTLRIPDHAIALEFDHILIDTNDGSIMVSCTKDSLITNVQKDLVKALSSYNHYYEPQSEAWEQDFHPHITIARELTPELLNQAKTELEADDVPLIGSIKDVTLVIVSNVAAQEAKLPKNRTRYHL